MPSLSRSVRVAWNTVACLARRKPRLRILAPSVPIPAQYRPWLACQDPACRTRAEVWSEILSTRDAPSFWTLSRSTRPHNMLLDLEAYDSPEAYAKALKKQTGGNLGREVRKAARLGYAVRQIDPECFRGSIDAIIRSKRVRAFGPVWSAFRLGPRPRDGEERPPSPPACPEHWELTWGVFRGEGAAEQLVAYAVLGRAGNLVFTRYFMGHGDVLREGVTKLLMHDMVAFLLDRSDATRGIRYLRYGFLEFGSEGLLRWKKAFQFAPAILERDAATINALPADFDQRRYRRLNPGVAASGMSAEKHWRICGVHYGLPYR